LVIVEGFKNANIPKIELWRAEHEECVNRGCKANDDLNILAIAYPGGKDATKKPELTRDIPVLNLDDVEQIAQHVIAVVGV
jgi:molybdopterin-guanine dinucleotide biosynthesis protein B